MALANYRISELSVEYFKGFTTKQTLSFDGRNVFLFGENGLGKSSIIEAIRWCLFGTSDVEVRNVVHDSQICRVSLVLKGKGDGVKIERTLRPGRTRSDLQITNNRGEELKFGDVLPQIAKLGAHASAQVICAAQQAQGRNVRPNITDFGKVLCFYLKLDDVPDLISSMSSLLQEQTATTENFSKQIERIADRYRQQQVTLQAQLQTLLSNPPWGEETTPTAIETYLRIKRFVSNLSAVLNQSVPAGLSSKELLQKAEAWATRLSETELANLQQQVDQLSQRIARLQTLISESQEASTSAATAEAKRRNLEEEIASLLAGRAREQLVDSIHTWELQQTCASASYSVAEQVAHLCDHHGITKCPACGSQFEDEELSDRVMFQLGAGATSLDTDQVQLENARRTLRALDAAITKRELAEKERLDAEGKQANALLELAALMNNSEEISLEHAELQLAKWQAERNVLSLNQASQRNERQQLQSAINRYRQEVSYHRFRAQIKELDRKLGKGMEEVRKLFREHQDYLHQINELKTLIETAFRGVIDRAIPTLNELLTAVFLRLTRHRQFQIVKVFHHPDKVGDLEVTVATVRHPDRNHSADMLNGQAKKAIQLVPYFVFSRLFQAELMELELLLIDDPSESFDTSHVGFLVEELRFASEHAQVIAASHEKQKFSPHIAEHFAPDSYTVMTVQGFDTDSGPEID